jgi:hypothetical protein
MIAQNFKFNASSLIYSKVRIKGICFQSFPAKNIYPVFDANIKY